MLVTMTRQDFDVLSCEELGWACMSPIMLPIRGKSPEVKSHVYSELTVGQRALFMFYAYYNHARNSLGEFYWWSAYYLAQPKLWAELKAAAQYIDDDNMLHLLEEVQRVLTAWNHPRSLETFDVSPDDIKKDTVLSSSVSLLNTMFLEMTASSLQRIGEFVRNHPGNFVCMED